MSNIESVVNVGLATAEGLAVDWITEHLYWVESSLDQIEVSDFSGAHRTTLTAGGMESPRAIVVDPKHGSVVLLKNISMLLQFHNNNNNKIVIIKIIDD